MNHKIRLEKNHYLEIVVVNIHDRNSGTWYDCTKWVFKKKCLKNHMKFGRGGE